jgi:hypothetical protein
MKRKSPEELLALQNKSPLLPETPVEKMESPEEQQLRETLEKVVFSPGQVQDSKKPKTKKQTKKVEKVDLIQIPQESFLSPTDLEQEILVKYNILRSEINSKAVSEKVKNREIPEDLVLFLQRLQRDRRSFDVYYRLAKKVN